MSETGVSYSVPKTEEGQEDDDEDDDDDEDMVTELSASRDLKEENFMVIPKLADKKNGNRGGTSRLRQHIHLDCSSKLSIFLFLLSIIIFFSRKLKFLVLKKISFYVKNIIFNNDWVSRTKILEQIYAMDSQGLNNNFNSTIRANLKRRVYDSVNVMVASGIVQKRSSVECYKREYFYKPTVSISKLPL